MAISNPQNSTSVLNPSVCISGADSIGSKLAINIRQDNHGFTAGSVIRWNSGVDGRTAEYVTAKADNAYSAEVAGVVSEVTGSNTFQLTMAGTVNMTRWFDNQSGTIPAGITRDDVYFLSGYTSGWMDNVRPETSGWVAKPIITRLAEDDQGNIFGNVTNYVGSLLGGNVAVSLNNLIPVGTVQSYLGTNPPSGWAICDGDGSGGNKPYQGLPISEYPDYYNEVGLAYGWCEVLKTDKLSWQIGSRLYQTVAGTGISGIVVGVSGGGSAVQDAGWIYVKQEYNNHIPGNSNFQNSIHLEGWGYEQNLRGVHDPGPCNLECPDGHRVVGATGAFPTRYGFKTFVHGEEALVYDNPYDTDGHEAERVNILSDPLGIAGIFSCLVPNFQGKFLMGAPTIDEDNTINNINGYPRLNRMGGSDRFEIKTSYNVDVEHQGSCCNLAGVVTGMGYQHILPPHITVNWIVRTNPNSYAALIDTLEIKNLRLTNLPTSGNDQEQWTVYQDSGDIKIKTET